MSLQNFWNLKIRYSIFTAILFIFSASTALGCISYIFLACLEVVQVQFINHPQLIYFIPLYGMISSLSYARFINNPITTGNFLKFNFKEGILPEALQGLFIVIFTVLSQLFGLSTGREGSAVQYGAIFTYRFYHRILKLTSSSPFHLSSMDIHNSILISSGVAAGISAVFGIPIAAPLFALELKGLQKTNIKEILFCLLASVTSFAVSTALGAHHFHYPEFTLESLPTVMPFFTSLTIPSWFQTEFENLEYFIFKMKVPVSFLCLPPAIALMSVFYLKGFHILLKISNLVKNPHFRIFFGGLFILIITWALNTQRFSGLGVNLIELSFSNSTHASDFLYKYFLLILAIASGFKGGEITPIMALGAILGSTINNFFGQPSAEITGLAMLGLLGGIVRIPWTASIMAAELLGREALIPALTINLVVYYTLRKTTSLYEEANY